MISTRMVCGSRELNGAHREQYAQDIAGRFWQLFGLFLAVLAVWVETCPESGKRSLRCHLLLQGRRNDNINKFAFWRGSGRGEKWVRNCPKTLFYPGKFYPWKFHNNKIWKNMQFIHSSRKLLPTDSLFFQINSVKTYRYRYRSVIISS